jgi:hypothetical protein
LQGYALFSLCATKQGNVVEPFFICGGAPLAHEDLLCNDVLLKHASLIS